MFLLLFISSSIECSWKLSHIWEPCVYNYYNNPININKTICKLIELLDFKDLSFALIKLIYTTLWDGYYVTHL